MVVVVLMEGDDAKLTFVAVELSKVVGVVEEGLLIGLMVGLTVGLLIGLLVGLLDGFVGFVDSTVGLGFVIATVVTLIDDKDPVFSVVVA